MSIIELYQLLMSQQGAKLLVVLLMVSEGLAMIPQVNANSVFQLIVNGLKGMYKGLFHKEPPVLPK